MCPPRRVALVQGVTVQGEGSQQELHAAHIAARISQSLAHVPAGDPLRPRCQADLVLAVAAQHGACSVGTVSTIVPRLGAPIPGIEPMIIVVNRLAIPA